MRTPLLYKVYWALRRGWKRITPDAQRAVQAFVASQKTGCGFMNAGGCEDAYYKQFGEVLEAVFSPLRLLGMRISLDLQPSLSAQDGRQKDTIYERFFRFLEAEKQIIGGRSALKALLTNLPPARTTNAACCILAMQYQTRSLPDPDLLVWLHERQDESGGFRATDQAPIPDLLSTAVALFTLRLLGAEFKDASDFIRAHWLDNGGFAPTIFDNYSDVEYVFYGLLALGSL